MDKQMGDPMTISEAKTALQDKTLQENLCEKGRVLISLAVDKLKAMGKTHVGGEELRIPDSLQKLINKAPSSKEDHVVGDEPHINWAEAVYNAVVAQIRFTECKDYLRDKSKMAKTIDGETASKWIGIATNIITVLSFFVINALNLFQNKDGTRNYDKASTYVGLIIACVGIGITFICWLWNRRQKKKILQSEYSYEELLAARYADSDGFVKALLPKGVKVIIKNKQVIKPKQVGGKDNNQNVVYGNVINNYGDKTDG